MGQVLATVQDKFQGREWKENQIRKITDRVFDRISDDSRKDALTFENLYIAVLCVYNDINKHLPGPHYDPPSKEKLRDMMQGVKAGVNEHSFFSKTSGSARGLGNNASLENTCRLMPSSVSSYGLSTARNGSVVQSSYPQLQSLQHVGQGTINSLPKQQQKQQQSFFGNEFGSPEIAKHETQSLHPFFDEWPKTRDSWSDLDEDRANHTSFSTTRLSISIPMASSDFSTTSSRSPNDADD